MDDHDPIAEIIAEWFEREDRLSPEQVVAAHPKYAAELRAHFAVLDLARQATRASARTPGPLERVGGYRVLREIGRGGMGVVYEAEQLVMKRRVALKVLPLTLTSTRTAVRRFLREARAAGRLHHTNIVPVHDLGQDGGQWYYAMELVDGRPLSDVLEVLRGSAKTEDSLARRALEMSPRDSAALAAPTGTASRAYFVRIAEMFAGVAEALHLAHEEGVVHRDVKPANLLLDVDGTLKIVDFGLAHVADGGVSMTCTGDIIGTPAYMSPEQAVAKLVDVDHRTDVYSLGATLYEVLTLSAPFRGATWQELCTQILAKEPVLPRRCDRRIPRDLETVVCKAMEKKRDKRYATASELARDLRRFAEGQAIRARRVGPVGRGWRRMRRHPVRSALAVVVLGLVVLAIGFGLSWVRESQLRVKLQYDRLVAEGSRDSLAWHEEYKSGWHRTGPARASRFSDAIELDPERPEAFLFRALASPTEPLESRLADLDEARDRGALPRAYHLARSVLLSFGGRYQEAISDHSRAKEYQSSDALCEYLEARFLSKTSHRAAMERVETALAQAEPDSLTRFLALRLRAVLRERGGDWSGALADCHALLDHGDGSRGTRFRIAALWRRLGREDLSGEAWDGLLDAVRGAGGPEDWRQLCFFTVRDSWMSRHSEVVREGLTRYPEDVELQLEHAYELASSRTPADWQRADDLCAEILAESADAWRAHRVRGLALMSQGRASDALSCFEETARIAPDHPARRTDLAWAQWHAGRPGAALDMVSEVLKAYPDYTRAHLLASLIYSKAGEYEEAARAAQRGLEVWPGEFRLHDALTTAYFGLGQWGKAAEDCERWARDYGNIMAWVNRAAALNNLGQYRQALASLTQADSGGLEDPHLHYVRGYALGRLGRIPEALAELDRAPDYVPATGHRAWLQLTAADPEYRDNRQGLETARRLVSQYEDSARCLLLLGVACYRSGQFEDSLRALRTSLSLSSNDSAATADLFCAMAGKRLGLEEEARASYERAVAWMDEHSPEDEELKRFRAEAEQVLGIEND